MHPTASGQNTRAGAGHARDPGHSWMQSLVPSPRPPSPPSLPCSQLQPGRGRPLGRCERLWWGQCAHLSPQKSRRNYRRPDGAVKVVWKGRQLFSQAAVGGSRGDRDRCGSPSRDGSRKAGFGSVPRLETTPAPQPNPRERPSRRRVWRRKRPETVQFHAALRLGFLGRVDELWGFEGFPGKLR